VRCGSVSGSGGSQGDVRDPRELKTILMSSLRSLWGDLEPHSCQLEVDLAPDRAKPDDCDGVSSSSPPLLVVRCPTSSAETVRAALTFVTMPPYYPESDVYLFDVVRTEEVT